MQDGIMEGLNPEKRLAQFTKHITEGTIYTIEDFNLYDAKRRFRSSYHPLRVSFTFRTKLKKVEPQPVSFPIFAHNARTFSVLLLIRTTSYQVTNKIYITFRHAAPSHSIA